MNLRIVNYALVFASLSGCASVQPVLVPTAAVEPDTGYVAGLFTKMKARGYAFVVKSVEGGAEYNMPLGDDTSWPTAFNDRSIAIKLPPGTYAISQWITYATLTREVMSRKPISGSALAQPFTVRSGSVTHLGSYDISESFQRNYPTTTTYMRIQPRPVTQADVQAAFFAAYPNLAKQPFRCVLCVDVIGR